MTFNTNSCVGGIKYITLFFLWYQHARAEDVSGIIFLIQPAIRGRNVSLVFKPFVVLKDVNLQWLIQTRFGTSFLSHSSGNRYRFSQREDKTEFYLAILNTVFDDGATYLASYNGVMSDKFNLELSGLAGCGYVYQKSTTVALGKKLQIGYLPGEHITAPQYYRHWVVFHNQGCSSDCIIQVNESEAVTEIFNEHLKEFVLTIQQITTGLPRRYFVKCAQSFYSNAAFVSLSDAPGQLTLSSPNHTGGVCSNCIALTLDMGADLQCRLGKGNQQLAMKLNLNGTFLAYSRDTTSLSRKLFVTSQLHGLDTKCVVVSAALTLPLEITKKMYVLLTPPPPKLNLSDLKVGQPGNVSCETTGARPAAVPYIYLDGKPKQTQKIEIFDELTEEYSVYTWIDKIQAAHDEHEIMCCLAHRTLTKPLCTEKQTIIFKYPPKTLSVKTEGPSQLDDKHTYFFLVKCEVEESVPLCTVAWNSTDSLSYTVAITGQLTQTAVLNLTRHDNGKIIECRAQCQDFPDLHLTEEVIINVPFAPEIDINITEVTILKETDPVVILCNVESNPHPETNWLFSANDTRQRNLTYCGFNHTCLLIIPSVTKSDSGLYTCIADNKLFNKTSKTVEIIVQELSLPTTSTTTRASVKKELNEDLESANTITWLAIGLAILVMSILVIVVAIAVKKKKQVNKDEAAVVERQPPSQDDQRIYANDARREDEDTLYAEYAVVIPKSQRNTNNTNTKGEHKELVYAELDLENPSDRNSTPVINRKESTTEYAVIEFSEKGNVSKATGDITSKASETDY